MPTNTILFLLAIPILSLQLILMTYGLVIDPQARMNRLFSGLMLTLAAGVTAIMGLSIGLPLQVGAAVVWLHTLSVFISTALTALLLLELLIPDWRYSFYCRLFVMLVCLTSVMLLFLDLFWPGDLVYQFNAASYNGVYIFLSDYLTGILGPLLYSLNVSLIHLFFPISILVLLLTGVVSPERRLTAVGLLVAIAIFYIINFVVWWLNPIFVPLIGSLSVAIISAWIILRYRVLSPVNVGLKQALDTAVFGVLVFDLEWHLLESNQGARRLLSIELNRGSSLFSLLSELSEKASNREGIQKFARDTAVSFAQNRTLGVILPDTQNNASGWLYLHFEPISGDGKAAGYLCTIEDQTAIRQAQAELEAVNTSLEKFAFQVTLLNDMTRTAISDVDFETMLQRFADRLGDMFGAVGCYITTWDDARGEAGPLSAYGPLRDSYTSNFNRPDHPSVTQTVLESGNPLIVKNIADSLFDYFYEFESFTGNSMLALPLISHNQELGAILIIFADEHSLTTENIALGQQAASQIALAISKSLILQAEREQHELAETLREINNALASTLDIEKILDIVLEQIARVIPYDTASVTLLEKGNIEVARLHGFEKFTHSSVDEMINSEGFSLETVAIYRLMVQNKRPLFIPDVTQFDGWVMTPFTRHVQSWIGVPLLVDGEVKAFLTVDKTEANFYQETHKDALATFAQQVSLALQRAQWFADSQRWTRQLATLNDLTAKLVGMVTVQSLVDLVVNQLHADFHFDNVVIFIIDPENETEMVLQSFAGIYAQLLDGHEKYKQSIHVGLIGLAVTHGDFVLENDAQNNPKFYQLPGMNIHSELVVPIRTEEKVLGVLNVESNNKDAFTENDAALLTIVADQLAVAIEKTRLFELTDRRAKELEILSIISARLRVAHTTAEMLNIILENTVEAIQASLGVIALIDHEQDAIISRAVYPWGAYPIGLKHRLDQGVTGHVAKTGEIYIASDMQTDPILQQLEGEGKFLDRISSGLSLPLKTEAMTIGVIHIGLAQPYNFTDAEIQLLTSITDISANALYRAQIMESLEERVDKRTRDLQAAYSRLKELDKLKSKFISDVTHELRTPVANLNLYLDLIEAGKPENKERYMGVIKSQTVRLTQIVENTLQMPHLEAGNGQDSLQRVDLADLVTTAVTVFSPKAEAKELTIACQIQSDLPQIFGDANQLNQVVRNVIANAINYTHEGQVLVTLTADAKEKNVLLMVEDSGIGIEVNDMPYIYDRFYRGQQVGQSNIPGMGLGLALVKEVVAMHNGRIEIDSQPERGTRCRIWLPAVASGGRE